MGKTRPTSVTVLGILNIVFGAWRLLWFVAVGAIVGLAQMHGRHPFRLAGLMARQPLFAALVVGMFGLQMLTAIVLVASGIGLLRMRRWARVASIIYAVYAIVAGLVGFATVVSGMLLMQARVAGWPELAVMTCVAMGAGAHLVYPVLLLIFMLRRNVVEAFRAGAEAPPT